MFNSRDIIRLLRRILEEVFIMSAELDALTAEVTDIETQADSIIALCNGLSAQIADLKQDPAALQALADSLKAKAAAIAAAVAANTPTA
jgi:hypothetical protein